MIFSKLLIKVRIKTTQNKTILQCTELWNMCPMLLNSLNFVCWRQQHVLFQVSWTWTWGFSCCRGFFRVWLRFCYSCYRGVVVVEDVFPSCNPSFICQSWILISWHPQCVYAIFMARYWNLEVGDMSTPNSVHMCSRKRHVCPWDVLAFYWYYKLSHLRRAQILTYLQRCI